MNKLGTILGGAYVALSLVCVLLSTFASHDMKGATVIKQLPIAVQGALIELIGFGKILDNLDWITSYAIIGGTTTVLLYLIGVAIDYLFF